MIKTTSFLSEKEDVRNKLKLKNQTKNLKNLYGSGLITIMKIINSESFSSLEHIQKRKELISSIIDAIFSISKLDKRFQLNEKVQVEELEVLKIKEKVNKQEDILTKISSLDDSLTKRISYLTSENLKYKLKLLSKLGVEE